MAAVAYPVLVMLGPVPGARGSTASVVEAYRAHGLFGRWPIEYIPTYGEGSALEQAGLAPKAFIRLAALLAKHRRLVLHVHTASQASFWRDACYVGAALAAHCPVILQLHGGGFDRFYDASGVAGQPLIRHILDHAACVAVASRRMAVRLHSVSPAVRATFVPTPVTITPLQEGARPNLILFLGSLRADKGIFDLLDALSQLRAAVPDVRLVCAGEGDRTGVARYAERLGIADAVKFTGWVGPSGKRALLESAAVYALPSYAEGMPVTLLEAMAAGVPVVASAVGGIPEVVVDGTSGFLAAPGDITTLQRLLRKLLLDRQLAARVGAAGRATVQARFAPEHALVKLDQLYTELGLAHTGIKPSPWPASQVG
jgi:glycosyltransferase involved in cell wall biosynthesis